MKKFFLLVLLGCSFLQAKSGVEILGLRVYGNTDEYRPPIILKSEAVTIEFDVTTSLAPNLEIIFKHASKDWVIDENLFINDPPKIFANRLSFAAAPLGVHHYSFRFKNSFPNKQNFVQFVYSGNYIFRIIDRDAGDEVLAEGKFIVAEELAGTSMTVANAYLPEAASPVNQVNYITVNVSVPNEYRADDPNSILHSFVKTVDIIQNWKLTQPYRIDLDDRNPNTFVDDFMKPNKKFWIRSVPTGNEYRRLDLSSVSFYPNNKLVISKEGADLSRYQWQAKPDANGASMLKGIADVNSDYLEVEMRLKLPNQSDKKIFLVGSFTNWEVLPEYEMTFDPEASMYTFRRWVRRGVYDYQYVTGNLDANGEVVDQDWMSLEGNDWRTTNRYTALVYYHDQKFGGFDRVVGIVRGRSPGGDEGKSLTFQGSTTGSVQPKK
ncbi:MAG: DUF5103 domain-containing protein [Bacteroidota bacterium]|nr:DUF5103 domain-containing protein [Bacteroidota bacterium]